MIIKIDGVTGGINALADGDWPFSRELRVACEKSALYPDGEEYLNAVLSIMGRGEIIWDGSHPDDPPDMVY